MTNKEEIRKALNSIFPFSDSTEHLIEEVEGLICINGLCPLPIKISSYFDRSCLMNIYDENSDEIGRIIFVERFQKLAINSLPEIIFYCFLIEYPTDAIADNDYSFQNDYVLIKKERLKAYLEDYKETSSVWGGFFHIEDLPNNSFTKTKSHNKLTAIKNIKLKKSFYLEALELIVNETNPFNRFLKLYHLIEMQFDMHTAERINQLLIIGNKEIEISRSLRDYNREDIERLKSLFALKLDSLKFIDLLNNIIRFRTTADSIFYDYGKDSNPIRSKKDFDALITLGSFNQTNINSVLGNNRFNDIIPKIISYWVYRIRSSIAHNKLGEYLMTVNDEEFMIEFAEPLIREVIIQCYKNQ